jgi:hypothetical protein
MSLMAESPLSPLFKLFASALGWIVGRKKDKKMTILEQEIAQQPEVLRAGDRGGG